jgi:hypothetical protein
MEVLIVVNPELKLVFAIVSKVKVSHISEDRRPGPEPR